VLSGCVNLNVAAPESAAGKEFGSWFGGNNLQTFLRLIVRHEVQPELFEGLVHAACMVIVLRRL